MQIIEPNLTPLDFVECRRGQFPVGTRYVDPKAADWETRAFMRAVRQIEPNAEILKNPITGRWALYRLILCGGVPADDLLRKELDLEHRPGWWVLNKMRRSAIVRAGETSMDPKVAGRQFLRELQEGIRARNQATERDWKECMNETMKQIDIWAVRGRCSDVKSRRRPRNKKPALRKGSPRILNPFAPPVPSPGVKILVG